MYHLAADQRGLTLDITNVPDAILKKIIDWRNELVEQERVP